MQQPNQQKTMRPLEDLFDKAKCQLHHRDHLTRIYHQVSLKELVRSHLEQAAPNDPIQLDLGPGADRNTPERDLADGKGRYGRNWAKVLVKPGLLFGYEIEVVSLKQELEDGMYEKSAETEGFVGGKMNLIETIDNEAETLVIDRDSDLSVKKSNDSKIVYNIIFEVKTRLILAEEVSR